MPGDQQRGGLHCAGQRVPAAVLSVPAQLRMWKRYVLMQ